VVSKVDRLITNDPTVNHEYLPIAGNAELRGAAAKLVLGTSCKAIAEKRVVSTQTISGTGANHLAGLFLSHYNPEGGDGSIYIPSPTWPNHKGIFENCHLKVKTYPYFDAETKGLDFKGLLSILNGANKGDVILLHACAHNPTGVDPTREQWKEIAKVCQERQLFPFFDCAYQGFASGDLENDGWAVRYFEELGLELLVCQSFAKNFGLYGERAGCLHFVAASESVAKAISTQLEHLQRVEISNPPAYGSRIVAKVLNDPELFKEWQGDLKTMASRIQAMRTALRSKLEALGTPGTWKHITDQIGMFSFTGLSPRQCETLVNDYHIYLTATGRVSMAGLNTHNVEYVAQSIDAVVRNRPGKL
jgi:aspartate aminotransferase, cytoplasmic